MFEFNLIFSRRFHNLSQSDGTDCKTLRVESRCRSDASLKSRTNQALGLVTHSLTRAYLDLIRAAALYNWNRQWSSFFNQIRTCNHSNCSNSTKTRPNRLRYCMGADQGHLQRHTSSDGPDNRVDAFACRCRILPCTGSIGPMRTRVGCLKLLKRWIFMSQYNWIDFTPDLKALTLSVTIS